MTKLRPFATTPWATPPLHRYRGPWPARPAWMGPRARGTWSTAAATWAPAPAHRGRREHDPHRVDRAVECHRGASASTALTPSPAWSLHEESFEGFELRGQTGRQRGASTARSSALGGSDFATAAARPPLARIQHAGPLRRGDPHRPRASSRLGSHPTSTPAAADESNPQTTFQARVAPLLPLVAPSHGTLTGKPGTGATATSSTRMAASAQPL